MKRFIKWLISLFRKNKDVIFHEKEVKQVEVIAKPMFGYDIVKSTPCKKHVWVNHPKYGMIRKPNGWLK